MAEAWVEAAEANRGALERLAEYGQTQLADDAEQLLRELDDA